MNIKFSFLKSTKNFTVFRELDSTGRQFPDDWEALREMKEKHKVGSIYIRTEDLPPNTKVVTASLAFSE